MSPHPNPSEKALVLPEVVVERVADRFRMLGDPTRLRLVNALHADGELAVGELVHRLGISYGAVSKQLALLRSHGLLSRRRDGNRIFYAAENEHIERIATETLLQADHQVAGATHHRRGRRSA